MGLGGNLRLGPSVAHSPRPLAIMRARPTLAALLLLVAAGCEGTPPPISSTPAPTDPRVGSEEGEETRRRQRERWLEEMHRTAPDVDWRSIERANQERERLRRNALVAQSRSGGGHGPASASSSWEEVGSRNQAGHTRCAALGPDRGGFRWLYVGSANGGVWRGPRDGSAWTPISDEIFGGADELVVLEPANLADEDIVIYRRGASVYRSDDGGATWTTPAGISPLFEIRRMVILPDGQQTVLLYGKASLVGNKIAIYASSDLGQTFQLRWNAVVNARGDMWVPRFGPGAGSDVYILHQGEVRKSTDGGFNFTLVGTADAAATDGHLQGSEAGAPTLYLALNNGGWKLYRSSDAGVSFTLQGDLTGYWGNITSLAAFSTFADAIFYGGVEGWRSFDGGASFARVNGWGEYYGDPANKLHADLRGLSPSPDPDAFGVTDLLYINTDGGTYFSEDFGQTVSNLSLDGLGVGQFYSTHTTVNDPDLIVGGTQDQGYQRGFKQPSTGSGPSTSFDQLISGDYGHLNSSDGTHGFVFSTYPGFILIHRGEQGQGLEFADFPPGASNLWLPPVVADPDLNKACFFLADHLWRYERYSGSWQMAQHSNHDFSAGGGAYLTAMAFAPSDSQRAYAINAAGKLFWSTDHGVTWTQSSNNGPGEHYFYGNALAVHRYDPLRAVVSGSGYSSPGVKETTDGGLTWHALDSGLPATMVYDITWSPNGSLDLYAATEAGAWRWDSAAGQWENIMGLEAPATTYWSVESVGADQLVRFGTYGRGIWDHLLGTVGETYCSPAVPNSTGYCGKLSAEGSVVVADDDLTLRARDLPPGQFGYLLASMTQDFVVFPGGSDGVLCLGGKIARFASQAQSSGPLGTFTVDVDLGAIPLKPPHAVAPGETWNFQAWYRDFHVVPTSNFTEGASVFFE